MGKPTDPSDSTQPLSDSMVVPEPKPPPKPVAAGDQSVMWRGTVVSAADFATAPPRKSRGKWLLAGVLGAAAVGGGGYLWMSKTSGGAGSGSAAGSGGSASTGSGSSSSAAAPASAPAPVDAAPALDAPAPVDASVDGASEPAATQPATPAKKPTTKKKKPVVKKKPH